MPEQPDLQSPNAVVAPSSPKNLMPCRASVTPSVDRMLVFEGTGLPKVLGLAETRAQAIEHVYDTGRTAG